MSPQRISILVTTTHTTGRHDSLQPQPCPPSSLSLCCNKSHASYDKTPLRPIHHASGCFCALPSCSQCRPTLPFLMSFNKFVRKLSMSVLFDMLLGRVLFDMLLGREFHSLIIVLGKANSTLGILRRNLRLSSHTPTKP